MPYTAARAHCDHAGTELRLFQPGAVVSTAPVYHAPGPVALASLIAVAVYGFAVPCVYARLLFLARHSLTRQQPPTPLSDALSFLVAGYSPSVFWWEMGAPTLHCTLYTLCASAASACSPQMLYTLYLII